MAKVKTYRVIMIAVITVVFTILFSLTAFAQSAPDIAVTGVSIRIPDGDIEGGLRFKVTVATPFDDGVKVVKEGTLLIPLYVNGEEDITLESAGVLNVEKTKNRYYTYEDTYYEYTAVLKNIPVYNLNTPICARGYVTYTVDGGEEETVYSDIAIFDILSIAEKMMVSATESQENKKAVEEFVVDRFEKYMSTEVVEDEGVFNVTTEGTVYPYADDAKSYLLATEGLDYSNVVTGDFANLVDIRKYRNLSSADLTNWQGTKPYDSAKAIAIEWECGYENVASYTVMYATKPDYSDAKFTWSSSTKKSVSLYNLFKATTYYVKVIANLKDGTIRAAESSFETADLGPRVIHLDGVANMRDMGGYMTSSGKRTLQSLIYRSGQLDPSGSYVLTDITGIGKYVAKNELSIKTDIDFRGAPETSPIPGATILHTEVSGYRLANEANQAAIRDTFRIFANINNYPIVFHCQGGADRTGTVAYLFNALLGVSELDVVRDYEYTSYSVYNWRYANHKDYMAKVNPNDSSDNDYYKFYATLNSQEGDTLQQRVENYLLGIGVTESEIANIKSIMFTGEVERKIEVPASMKLSESTELVIGVNGKIGDIDKVYIGGQEVKWEETVGGIAVSVKDFPESVEAGEVAVKVVFSDNEEKTGNFTYDNTKSITINNDYVSKAFSIPLDITVAPVTAISKVYVDGIEATYVAGDTGITVTLPLSITKSGVHTVKVAFIDSDEISGDFYYDASGASDIVSLENYIAQTTTIECSESNSYTAEFSSQPVGYNRWIKMDIVSTPWASGKTARGNIQIYVGSYGLRLTQTYSQYYFYENGGSKGKISSTSNFLEFLAGDINGGKSIYFYMKVDEIDENTVGLSILSTDRSGNVKKVHNYVVSKPNKKEFSSEEAAVTFVIIGNSDSGTKTLTVKGRSN